MFVLCCLDDMGNFMCGAARAPSLCVRVCAGLGRCTLCVCECVGVVIGGCVVVVVCGVIWMCVVVVLCVCVCVCVAD